MDAFERDTASSVDPFSASDKSIVIYFPDSIVDNPSTLTSMCLYHDQVVLFSFEDPIELVQTLKHSWRARRAFPRQRLRDYFRFVESSLKVLGPENVLTVVTPRNLEAKFPRAAKLEVTYQMLQEFAAKIGRETRDAGYNYVRLSDLFRTIMAFGAAKEYKIPLVTDKLSLPQHSNRQSIQEVGFLSDILARSAITNLALPDLRTSIPEDILRAREALREELMAFRIGVLDLTFLLRQNIQNRNDLEEAIHEADAIVNTKIKASLIDLEHRIAKHNDSRIRRLLFASAKIGLDVVKLFLPGGVQEKIIAGAKSLFELATAIDEKKAPEDQIASFIYGLKSSYYQR